MNTRVTSSTPLKNFVLLGGPIGLAYLSMVVLGIADNVRGPLFLDILKSFSLDHSRGSLFFSIASLMVLPGGYFAGYLLKKVSLINALRCSLALMTFSILGFAISKSFAVLLIFVPLFGMALAMQGVVQNVTVLRVAKAETMQRSQSRLHSIYGFASLLAPLIVILVYRYSESWQSVFLVAGVFAVVALLSSFLFSSPNLSGELESSPGLEIKNKRTVSSSSAEVKKLKVAAGYFGLMMAIYVNVEVIIFTHITEFARQGASLSIETSNLLTTLVFAALFAGRLLFSFWQPPIRLISQMNLCLISAILSMVLGIFVSPWFFVISSFSVAPFYPMGITAAGYFFSSEAGTVTSHIVALSGITVVVMQTGVGLLTDHWGISCAMMLGPLFAVISVVMMSQFSRIIGRRWP
jgi:fucose permease